LDNQIKLLNPIGLFYEYAPKWPSETGKEGGQKIRKIKNVTIFAIVLPFNK
jgi:hypothetical protein